MANTITSPNVRGPKANYIPLLMLGLSLVALEVALGAQGVALGVLGFALGPQGCLDTNMFVTPTQNGGVGGIN